MNTHFGSTRKYARYQDRKAADKKAEEAAKEKLAVNDINYPILGGGWSTQVGGAAKPEMNYAAIAVASEVRDSSIQAKKDAAAAVARRNAFEAEAIRLRRQKCCDARMSTTRVVEPEEEEEESGWGGAGGGGGGSNWIGSGAATWENEKGDWDTVVRKKIKPVSRDTLTFEAAPVQQSDYTNDDEDPEWYNPHEKGSLW